MILRPPTFLDHQFLCECYSDWPVTEKNPPITPYDLKLWIRRWMNRSDEIALIGVEGAPVGFIKYRRGQEFPIDMRHAVFVDNLIVHPMARQQGYANEIVRALRDLLVTDGVTVAQFNALAGPVAEQVERGKYEKLGEVAGNTGTLVQGRLTVDMPL